MTETPTPKSEKDRVKEIREERLAKNLRDNLRRRKAAVRKVRDKKTGDTGP